MKPLKTTAIPEISYSSSEDEDFFDAEEDDSDDDDDGSEFDKITFCDLTSFSICVFFFLQNFVKNRAQKICQMAAVLSWLIVNIEDDSEIWKRIQSSTIFSLLQFD